MFHKILVAIDRSELIQGKFDEILALVKTTGASLILLNVLSPDDEESPSTPILSGFEFYPGGLSTNLIEIYQELWQNYAAKRLELLRSLADKATAAGIETTFHQALGNPGLIICDLAREQEVDLIILGRRGRSGLSELILGSVSNYVLHHAPCSVLTIQRHHQKQSGSTEAKEAKHVATV
ncbi:MAG: universal stress protein [Leptolyngbya sp. BL-A-14]